MDNIMVAKDLVRCFKTGGEDFYALKGVDIEIPRSRLTILKGRSGSGKTTLLNSLSTLDKPTSGEIWFDNLTYSDMTDKDKERLRRQEIGFVFQSVALIPIMTSYENVDFALRLAGKTVNSDDRINSVLDMVGMQERMRHMPSQMSGGEQQRVAIARAIVHEPKVVFADEPTGAVDTKTSNMIQDLFRRLNRELGITVIIVTHDLKLAAKVDRVVMISDGKISTEKIMKEKYREQIENLSSEDIFKDAHEEYFVMDKAHRVQLSEDILTKAGIVTNKVCISVEDGRVVIVGEKK